MTALKFLEVALALDEKLVLETFKGGFLRPNVEELLKELTEKMTPAQIAVAKRKAREMVEELDPTQVAAANRQFRMMKEFEKK